MLLYLQKTGRAVKRERKWSNLEATQQLLQSRTNCFEFTVLIKNNEPLTVLTGQSKPELLVTQFSLMTLFQLYTHFN
ncbi:hypothetical protein Gasu2_19480 [Galdieria sulphuraria]|nr:hypothetical protein Gasu2_19480 [Galdieria sulphuraria]